MNLQAKKAIGQKDEEGPSAFTHNPRSLYERTADPRIGEQPRIRQHLLAVETQLRTSSPPGLSTQQQARREKMLDVLADYRVQGVFPKNNVVADGPSPVFIDEENVHCAVGYLIKESGHAELASKVRDLNNFIYLPDLKDEAFIQWTQAHGLTPTECAKIQPTYDVGAHRTNPPPSRAPITRLPPTQSTKPPAVHSSKAPIHFKVPEPLALHSPSSHYPTGAHHPSGEFSPRGWWSRFTEFWKRR